MQAASDDALNTTQGVSDLFSHRGEQLRQNLAPLADRLRPRSLDDFQGQEEILGQGRLLRRAITADRVGNLILYGPPGVGKTTLARIIAATTRAHFSSLNAVLAGVKDLRTEVDEARRRLEQHGLRTLLFIDEVHRLSRVVEEILYPAMEDFQIDIVVGKGPAASSIRLTLPRFTLIGATTRTGMITGPLRDRFGLVTRLEYYEPDELRQIVQRAAGILDVAIDHDAAHEIASRSRGTPRIANRLLRRVRDFAQVRNSGAVTAAVADEALRVFGVDRLGLDKVDRSVLQIICERFGGGPVGLSTLAIAVSEQTETIEDVYEPFLIREGLLARTPRGRVATTAAYEHLGLTPPDRSPELF